MQNFIITKNQSIEFVEKLDKLLLKSYTTKKSLEVLDEVFTEDELEYFKYYAKNASLVLSSKDSVNKVAESLKNCIQEMITIELELSFVPTVKTLSNISELVGENTLLDITVNPQIVGGAIIKQSGVVTDYSLAKQVNYERF